MTLLIKASWVFFKKVTVQSFKPSPKFCQVKVPSMKALFNSFKPFVRSSLTMPVKSLANLNRGFLANAAICKALSF